MLCDFRPKSQLVVNETKISKLYYPLIDGHNHLGAAFDDGWINRPVQELLDFLDEVGVEKIVDLEGGWGEDILEKIYHQNAQCVHQRGGYEQMTERGEYTLNEIMSQPSTWSETLKVFKSRRKDIKELLQDQQIDRIIFTGCGSTHYLSMTAAALFQTLTSVPSHAYPASELVLFPDMVFAPGGRTLLVAISRSGETSETIEAISKFRALMDGLVIGITCYGDHSVAKQADLSLVAEAAHEDSVAQTRSFSNMVIMTQAMAGELAKDSQMQALERLPDLGQKLINSYRQLAQEIGTNPEIERFVFLGGGELYGIACEAMLKMKEMSLSYSEAFHPLEFRHGPMSMVNNRTLIVGLLSDKGLRQEVAVLKQMQEMGAHILAITEENIIPDLGDKNNVIHLRSGLAAWPRTILYLPILQLIAYYRSMSRGQNPDRPANLSSVVRLGSLE
jgi:glucosamine--fructose-6-phosphate aminotransferase (isomerizing)